MAETDTVKFRILIDSDAPPRPDGSVVRFGLQDGKGNIHPPERRADGMLAFPFSLAVKAGPDPARPVFTGAFASGPRDERFVYLSWQRLNGEGYVNRMKVRLTDIDWPLVRAAQQAGMPLEIDVSGRGGGGGRVPAHWAVAAA